MVSQAEENEGGTARAESTTNSASLFSPEKPRIGQQREDLKFGIGLATGALIFSVTFIEKLAPHPLHKWLLLFGWSALLISIFTAIELLRRLHTLESLYSENFWKSLVFFSLAPADKALLIEIMANYLGTGKDAIGTVTEMRAKLHHDWGELDSAEIFQRLETVCNEDPRLGALRPLMKFAVGLKRWSHKLTPEKMVTMVNRTLWWSHYLLFVSIYTFYTGLLLIALFSGLNFLR
jgi:hypothetical protein